MNKRAPYFAKANYRCFTKRFNHKNELFFQKVLDKVHEKVVVSNNLRNFFASKFIPSPGEWEDIWQRAWNWKMTGIREGERRREGKAVCCEQPDRNLAIGYLKKGNMVREAASVELE